jgi:large subunit ribosomal protein L29
MKLREIRKRVEDYRGMDMGRLADQLAQLKKEQFNLRFQQATGQLSNPARMRQVREMIARVQTVMRAKRPTAEV